MPARNLGESQARPIPKVNKTNFSVYDTAYWSKGRNIKTTVEMEDRKYDRFYEKQTMQDFLDDTAETYGKKGKTYG